MEVHSRSNPATTFIYGLWDPRDSRLRYIGKTNDPNTRLKHHLSAARLKAKRKNRLWHWIRSLLDEGLKPELEVLVEVPFGEWESEEKAWIAECRENGLDLVNLTDGGIGFKGGVLPPEAREKISKASSSHKMTEEQRKACSERNPWRGKDGWMKGKKFTEEHKRKISESHLGEKNPCWGRKPSKEETESRAVHLRGVPRSTEVREKISATYKQRRIRKGEEREDDWDVWEE